MENEIWKSIAGYEGIYEVSNFGRVRVLLYRAQYGYVKKLAEPRILKLERDKDGYSRILLVNHGKKHRNVHRLVLFAFVGPPPDNHQAAHLDGSKDNNRVENLRWVTRTENESHKALHGTRVNGENLPWSKVTTEEVRVIRNLRKTGLSFTDIGKRFGISRVSARNIVDRRTWKHVT